MSIKRIQIDGRLGGDATVETSRAGKKYISFSIAHDEYENGKNVTEWYSVVVMNQELISYYENKNSLKKGNLVLLNGRFRTEKRTNKEGIEKEYTTIFPDIIDNIYGGKNYDSQTGNTATNQTSSTASKTVQTEANTTSFTVDKPVRNTASATQSVNPIPSPNQNPIPSGGFDTSSEGEDDLPF